MKLKNAIEFHEVSVQVEAAKNYSRHFDITFL
jgi:hypothetical protein